MASLPAKALPGMTGLPGGPHNLADKALRLGRSTPSVADTAGPNMQVIVTRIHGAFQWLRTSDGSGEIDLPDILAKAPAGDFMRCSVTPSLPTTNARRQSALLSRHPRLISPRLNCRTSKHAKRRDVVRSGAISIIAI